ncbi:hypothetical protein [Mesonia mobilis]|uniref:hypothetical protein n=1 Tax=Mesonia mobilis TaxID=369791 RepID=UPI0024BB1CF7|nr:hypothetical protein [Mesonia mobilis]
MSITKITIKTNSWDSEIQEFIPTEKEYTTEDQPFLEDLVLEHLNDQTIKDYALENCDVVEEESKKVKDTTIFETHLLIEELKLRGFEVLKCETLADTDRFEKLKENMQL